MRNVHVSLLFSVFQLLLAETGLTLDFNYHHTEQVETFLNDVSRTYPSITELYSVGQSTQGRELWVLAIGLNPREHVFLRPNVKYIANMHGNEPVGREMMLHFIEYLVEGYGNNNTIADFLNNTLIHVMPSMNPDGFEASSEGDCSGLIGRGNGNDVDLNRNFPDVWDKPSHPEQLETTAVKNWLKNFTFVLSANFHGGALVANYPLDNYERASETNHQKYSMAADDDVLKHLALVFSKSHHTMYLGAPCPTDEERFTDGITNGAMWYPISGGMQDYNYLYDGCLELTMEISCCKYPAANTLPDFWEENRAALLNYLLQVDMGVRGVITDENDNRVGGATLVVQERQGATFKSSKYGEYWRLLFPGHYTLTVTSEGYSSESVVFEVKDGTISRVDMRLKRATSGSSPNTYQQQLFLCITVEIILFFLYQL